MISITYPHGDYSSADLAIKLQALAQTNSQKIYVVPKHFGRDKTNIYKNLENTNAALLLLHDKLGLDKPTKDEVVYLVKKKAVVYSIAPIETRKHLKLPNGVTSFYYDQAKSGDFLKTVQKIISDLEKVKKEKSNDDNLGGLLLLMALVILVISAVFSSDDKK